MTRIKVRNCHEAQVIANAWDAEKQLFHWIAISSFVVYPLPDLFLMTLEKVNLSLSMKEWLT